MRSRNLPKRQNPRLPEYDYSQNGAYFVTICTQNRAHLFPFSVGAAPCGRPHPARQIAEEWLNKVPEKFPGVSLCKYVVMPNHIHALFLLDGNETAGGHTGPPLPEIIDWYKTMTTNAYIRAVKAGMLPGFTKRVWQRSFHDHIIRDEADFLARWEYIDQNPAKWAEDEYFDHGGARQ